MFTIAAAEEGFQVSWDTDHDDAEVRAFRKELLLRGLTRARDTSSGTIVRRYRNQHETLNLIIELLNDLNIEHDLDEGVRDLRTAQQRELAIFERARTESPSEIGVKVAEFPGRDLLAYQAVALARHLHDKNAADFSVPGSGKTTVALAYWAHVRREIPNLGLWVVGPLSCFRPWEDEFGACFGRPPDAVRLQGNAQQRNRILQESHRHSMILSSYHVVWRDATPIISALQRKAWLVVLDEAHYVKSMHGALANAVREIAPFAFRRMVLTGTPMPHGYEDLWTPFTFLWPSEALLGSATQYALRVRSPTDVLNEQLREELGPFFHRTCKQDLDLPLVDATYPVIAAEDIPRSQRLLLRLVERRTLEEVTYLNPRDRAHLRRWRRARIVRLMQAASNPLMLADALDWGDALLADDDSPEPGSDAREGFPLTEVDSALALTLRRYQEESEIPAKIAYVTTKCRELVADGHKVVIWTVFLRNVELLEQQLSDLLPLSITGAVPNYESEDDESGEETREQRINLFKTDPNRKILIANMAACSESVSLHRACQHAIYLERSFNAAQFVQSLDRIHRQGMPPGTTAHVDIPSIPCAIERVIDQRLRERQARLYRLLDDPMPIVGFDDESHRGLFDIEDADELEKLFADVLTEIRKHLAEESD